MIRTFAGRTFAGRTFAGRTFAGRAWTEVDLSALRHNAQALAAMTPQGAAIMAVIKADAYGHGDVRVARTLYRCGVRDFAVATLEEGMRLRKHMVRGRILVLGYTDPREAATLRRWRLAQTAVDAAHAQALDAQKKRLRVHLALDTGMHRLGTDVQDGAALAALCNLKRLRVEGVFTHLCVSDELTEDALAFTATQAARFRAAVETLHGHGLKGFKTHAQATYGLMNHPELRCDFARVGIGLYGVLSQQGETLAHADLQPALALRARVAQVRRVAAGESVGYGRAYTAKTDMAVAAVTAGDADGIPRSLSGAGAHTLIHGQRAPIIGRICMDQLLADVSGIVGVKPGDIVTLIGRDGPAEIRCEDFAGWCGTISNEILSRLGGRLGRIYLP